MATFERETGRLNGDGPEVTVEYCPPAACKAGDQLYMQPTDSADPRVVLYRVVTAHPFGGGNGGARLGLRRVDNGHWHNGMRESSFGPTDTMARLVTE